MEKNINFMELFNRRLYLERCQNIDLCISSVRENDKTYLDKIKKFCKNNGLDPNNTINKIKNGDRDLAAHFSMDPLKQGFSERIQLEFLSEILGVPVIKLNADHYKGKFIYNGKIVSVEDLPKDSRLKTLDYYAKFNDKDIYFAAKYTKSRGGAQVNQYNDLMDQFKEAKDINDDNIYFIALCDGNHYDSKLKKFGYKSTREMMNDLYGTDHSRALSSDEVYNFLNNMR